MITRRRTVPKRRSRVAGGHGAGAGRTWAQSEGVRAIFWGGLRARRTDFFVFDLFQKKFGTAPVVSEFMGFNDYWPKVADADRRRQRA